MQGFSPGDIYLNSFTFTHLYPPDNFLQLGTNSVDQDVVIFRIRESTVGLQLATKVSFCLLMRMRFAFETTGAIKY